MKFGIRECANIVFKAKQDTKINEKTFHSNQTVLYIDSATITELKQQSSSVYALGGRGGSKLIAWEGDKNLTFTITDALMSIDAFNLLAGDINGYNRRKYKHFHSMQKASLKVTQQRNGVKNGRIDLTEQLKKFGDIIGLDEMFVITDNSFPFHVIKIADDDMSSCIFHYNRIQYHEGVINLFGLSATNDAPIQSEEVLVDFYIFKALSKISTIQITPQDFAGYYYIQADTLFRNTITDMDMPAILTFPNVKLQSNFTVSLSSTGQPNTFEFTIDAFPGYTYFDKTKKVLCAIQIAEDVDSFEYEQPRKTVMEKNQNRQEEGIFNEGISINNMLKAKNHVDYDLKPDLEEQATLVLKADDIDVSELDDDLFYRKSTLRDLQTLKNYLNDNFIIIDGDTCYIQDKSLQNIFPEQSDVKNDPVNRLLKRSDVKKLTSYINSFNSMFDEDEDTIVIKGRIDV